MIKIFPCGVCGEEVKLNRATDAVRIEISKWKGERGKKIYQQFYHRKCYIKDRQVSLKCNDELWEAINE